MSWAGLWKPGVYEIIPPEWVWGVVDALDWLYMYHNQLRSEVQQTLDCVEKKLDVTNHYLRLIAPGRGVKTLVKTVTTTAEPLFTDELTVRRIIVKVPSTALYVVYLGDSQSQDFPLEPGKELELFVKDPRQVYVRSEGNVNVFLLFELAHE